MIRIEERECEKLSGLTSLFISFDYREDIVYWLKQNIDTYNYNKKTKEWETTILELSKILDSLCFLDEITLTLYDNDKHEKRLPDFDLSRLKWKLKPYDHQFKAIEYGLTHDKWLLLSEMGLGKTAIIIAIARYLKEYKGLKHCLIICGVNTLKANWKKEIQLHSDETFRVIGEKVSSKGNISYATISERAKEIRDGIDEFFIITNIETLRSDDVINALRSRTDIDMIALDEAHKVVNKQAIQSTNLLKLNAKYKIASTGTLLVNTPINAYTSLKWLDIDKSTLTNFKKQYCVYGGFGGHEVVGYKNLELLKEEIDNNSVRQTKENVLKDLPKKNIIKEYVTLSDEHRKFYNNIKKGVRDEALKVNLSTNNLLALTTRLRQATSCPGMLTTEIIESSKLLRAVDLIEQIVEGGDKVVVFSTFKQPCYELEKMLPKKYNALLGTGDIKDSDVSDNIDKFQNEDKYKVFIGTTSKMGTGVTLTRASYMICIDQPYTYSQRAQMFDRIYRIGTKLPVFIYVLIAEDTMDEHIDDIVETKGDLSSYIIDNKQITERLKQIILES